LHQCFNFVGKLPLADFVDCVGLPVSFAAVVLAERGDLWTGDSTDFWDREDRVDLAEDGGVATDW